VSIATRGVLMRKGKAGPAALAGWALLFGMAGAIAPTLAAEQADAVAAPTAVRYAEAEPPSAPVEVDGEILFRVRGVSALPADERASRIAERLRAVAADPSFGAASLRGVESDAGTEVVAGDRRIMTLTDADALLEGVPRVALATAIVARMSGAIEAYRSARTPEALTKGAALALVATVLLAVFVFLLARLRGRVQEILERRLRSRLSVEFQSFQFVRAERLWAIVRHGLSTLRGFLVLVLLFSYVQFVLARFPWTRSVGLGLLEYALDPVRTIARSFVASIPSLLFLAVIGVITWYVLTLLHLFARAIAREEVRLANFDADWAEPTYNLARLAVLGFAAVVAYPHIPGSNSEAFRGVSVFVGVMFSLGSSSAIANLIAGYTITYRRAFKVGDRVKIGETFGEVQSVRLQATYVRTIKNETVTIPNSCIVGAEVVNYSTLAATEGLILHTTIGIGYETAWRQVEAMLKMAADRTAGVLADPAPFVLQKGLGDFAVTYEVNAHTRDARRMAATYSELHRNILDVFNEYGVQIMTPAYEGDPEQPKIVPKGEWHTAPAPPPAPPGGETR